MSAPEDRKVAWPTFVYYYLGALIGLTVMIGGGITFAIALVANSNEAMLGGVLVALVGLPAWLWHLAEARKREHY